MRCATGLYSLIIFVVVVIVHTLAFISDKPYSARRIDSPKTLYCNSDTMLSANDDDNNIKHIVLIGGGHAHVQVIKALNSNSRPPNVHVTLIDLQTSASYSGKPIYWGQCYLWKQVFIPCIIC